MSEARPAERESVARWLAVSVLGAAGIIGVAWSLTLRPTPAPQSLIVANPSPPTQQHPPGEHSAHPPQESLATTGGTDVVQTPIETPAVHTPASQSVASRLIDINTATAAEFELLPGIGPTLAQRIVGDRNANGKFKDVNDLDRVRGIGPRTVERLRDLVTAN